MGDLAAFSVRQEAALSVCEARKDAAVAVIDAYNQVASALVAKPKRAWWRFW